MPEPVRRGGGSRFAPLWSLSPDVAYLNHGSFGACPIQILEHQRWLRTELEAEPVDFLVRALPGRLAEAREALGRFVGASPDDLAFVNNATAGVNAVMRSLALAAGDEILTTDQTYGACRRTLDYVAARAGARVVAARVPFPLAEPAEVVEPILSAVSSRTRIALIDHVVSATGLVFPVERIVAALRERGVETMIDGAHALGMAPLDLDALGAAFYTANAHKWLCAPKGAAMLHVRRDQQEAIHPAVISWGYEPTSQAARFRAEFDWTGTVDPTGWLCIPACIDFLGGLLPGGWAELRSRNHALALEARALLGEALGVAPGCPESMVGALAAVPLPRPDPSAPAARLDHEAMMSWFRERGIETWLYPWDCDGGMVIRASAQIYNDAGQYRRLAAALRAAVLGG
jgi:isopenicillin-N epimerase